MWCPKPGVGCEGEVILFAVAIEGKNHVPHIEHFTTREDAILASAVDGQNRLPTEKSALKFSDGSYIVPEYIGISCPPSAEQTAKLLDSLTPAQRILLRRS